jgi:type I restriction enzyme, S subunit
MREELPSGWTEVALSDICSSVSQSGPDPASESFRYIDLGAIDNKARRIANVGRVDRASAPSRAKQVVAAGDVLFSTVRVYLENIALVSEELDGSVASTAFTVLRPSAAIDPGYLYRLVSSKHFVRAVNALQRGNSPPSVQDVDVRRQLVPLPPHAEQQRIVSRIEELFSEIDEGERALARAQKLVDRHRQSVLKAAVTGELTRGWRGGDGATGLPRTWHWAPLGELIESGPQNGLYLHRSAYGFGFPILRIDDFQPGWVRSVDELQRVNADEETRGRYSLRESDLVVNRVNSPSHLGKCMVVDRTVAGALFESNMMRFRVQDRLSPSYLELYLRCEVGRRNLTSNAKHAVNQASINQRDVAATPVPVPPIAEQAEIVDRAARAMLDASEVAGALARSELQAAALRQSILKAAFSGHLVPQDPTDEPASALLARLAGAPSTTPAAKRSPRRRATRRLSQPNPAAAD